MFGKGNVAGRERARNELERIRREEGGVIDRYEWEEFVEENAKSDPGVPSYYSCPSHDAGGGLWSEFEPLGTESRLGLSTRSESAQKTTPDLVRRTRVHPRK